MRSLTLSIGLFACCLVAATTTSAQTPTGSGGPPSTGAEAIVTVAEPAADEPAIIETVAEEQVFEDVPTMNAVGVRPVEEPDDAASPTMRGGGIDPRALTETMTNSMIGTGVWDPTLGGQSTGSPEIDRYIVESATKHGVDPKLVFAVMQQESSFKKNAVSPKGASGYMQLMPGTARRFGVTDIFDPRQNIDAGTKYLRFLLDLFRGNVELALAGYNAGEYRVIRDGYRVPQIRETQNYVKVISSRYYGKTKRHYQVVYGKSMITEKDREEIQLAAVASSDDRGTDSLSNIY